MNAVSRTGPFFVEPGAAATQGPLRIAFEHHRQGRLAGGQLATLLRGKLPDEDLQAMRRLLADPDLTPFKRAGLRLGLAQLLDARKLEGVARQLVTWCGLNWEPDCLNFHQGKRPVRTASVTQVRQPIYQFPGGPCPHTPLEELLEFSLFPRRRGEVPRLPR